MECLHCHSDIDDDACFCDQCGAEVMVCSRCGEPGAKKRCRFDGEELVPARQLLDKRTARTEAPAGTSPVAPPVLTLVNNTLGVQYRPQHEDVLGRREGPLAHVLGAYGAVSGRHAAVQYAPETGWVVVDLASTNGTTYDGQALASRQPVPLHDGGMLVLARTVELCTRVEPPPTAAQPLPEQVRRPDTGTIRV